MGEPAKWVGVSRVSSGGPHYECVSVEHLTAEENGGRHNAFIWVEKNGRIVRDGTVQIEWGWDNMNDTQVSPVKCDKQLESEPSCDVTIFVGMRMWVRVLDKTVKLLDGGIPSDLVSNLNTRMDANGGGNSFGHHSYNIHFKLVNGEDTQPEQPDEPQTWQEAFKRLSERIDGLESKGQILSSQKWYFGADEFDPQVGG